MKKSFAILITLLFIANYSCKEKVDFEKEKEAIMAVLEEETAAYYASDFERWSAVKVQDSTFINVNASKSGYNFSSGWESILENAKPTVVLKREPRKEVKTPIRIKIYGETAWILFFSGNSLRTCFLENHDGIWKIVYRNQISGGTYSQADNLLINSINYAKSLGKSVEDIAIFTGDQFKTGWNKANGYNGFVNGMLTNWRNVAIIEELIIQEQDDNHIIFSANKIFTDLLTAPRFNVTYDDYLTFYKVVCEKIGEYMGAIYKQETTPDGVIITITKE